MAHQHSQMAWQPNQWSAYNSRPDTNYQGLPQQDGDFSQQPGDDSGQFEVPPGGAKVAFNKGFTFVKRWTNVLHVGGVAGAIAALAINLKNQYGWDLGRPPHGFWSDDNFNKLMLLPAKFLDTFIVASFTAVMLQVVIQRLTTTKGVPLALLGSGYQIGNLQYLSHGGLWRAALSSGERITDKRLAWALIFSVIYGATVGWSCNIVLSTRLAWWPDTRGTVYNTTLHPYLNVEQGRLYPTRIGSPNMTQIPGCDTASYSFTCPGAAFTSLNDWTTSWANQGSKPSLTMMETASQARRAVALDTKNITSLFSSNTTESQPGQSSNIAIGTTLPQSVLELSALFWEYIYSNPSMEASQIAQPKLTTQSSDHADSVQMPYVQVQCAVYDYAQARKQSTQTSEVVFPTDVLDGAFLASQNATGPSNTTSSNTTTSIRWPVDPSLWNLDRPLDTVNFTWVDVSKYQGSGTSGASIGALFTLPKAERDNAKSEQASYLVPCIINAKWSAAILSYEAGSGANVNGTLDLTRNTSIAISPQWASLLNIASSKSNSTGKSWNGTMLQSLVTPFIAQNDLNSTSQGASNKPISGISDVGINAIPHILAAVMTEGLARQAYDWNWPMVVFGSGQDKFSYASLAQNFAVNKGQTFNTNTMPATVDDASKSALVPTTPFDFRIRRYGYGWGPNYDDPHATAFVIFGCIVLAIYIIIVLAHVTHSWYSFSLHSWHSIEHMLGLGLASASHRHELQGASAGLTSDHAGKRVFLREKPQLNPRGGRELELYVGEVGPEERKLRLPKLGYKYD